MTYGVLACQQTLLVNYFTHLITSIAPLGLQFSMATAAEDAICVVSKVVLEVRNEFLALFTLETGGVPHQIWPSMLHLSVDVELAM